MKRSTQVLLAGGCTSAAAVVSSMLLKEAPAGAVRVIVALAPLPFMLWFIYVEVVWLRSLDEFHRRVLFDALAISFPAGIFMAMAVEALQKAGFLPGVTVGDMWPVMALVFVPSLWLVYRHYDRGE